MVYAWHIGTWQDILTECIVHKEKTFQKRNYHDVPHHNSSQKRKNDLETKLQND